MHNNQLDKNEKFKKGARNMILMTNIQGSNSKCPTLLQTQTQQKPAICKSEPPSTTIGDSSKISVHSHWKVRAEYDSELISALRIQCIRFIKKQGNCDVMNLQTALNVKKMTK